MSTDNELSQNKSWERPSLFYNKFVKYVVYLSILLFLIWSVWELRISFERFIAGIESSQMLITEMFPPDYGDSTRPRIWSGILETLAMAVIATVIGVGISIPIAFIAAGNLVPKPVYLFGRSIVMISRALHELVLAIVIVTAVGFGPLAGILALTIATPGFFAKLLSEDLEDIDEGQINAIRAVGASRSQVATYGILPQVMPRIIGLTVYRMDINIRASTIVGIVGAGGIGMTLMLSFDTYQYDFTLAILLVIVAIVLLGEMFSAWIRNKVQ
ncbi:phosphonate ABC transporter, permease protein PhnE [Natrarchaeobius halalkaliphilus]|uniref:Phosphonate ABC transporter, permease protein PhnE n=1 Tax=Natrarchaeobius halalkaliphilus TaxID=1679091 RepID=A0A3N6MR65_9EURY|nr:phosphonate ABC transporter, permease protein PhnE [Natrarchaeobius halalkaliphilus]RQG86733.1 phosphonate ABC transporter, permease protein PhnE [Natrarchaeobius halalkaliphilus]